MILTTSTSANIMKNTMKEPIDLLLKSGLRSGEIIERADFESSNKDKSKYKRIVYLYLFDKQKRLLVQRRAKHVKFPLTLCVSTVGHVDAGEYSQKAVERELQEELGLNAKNMNIKFLFSYIMYNCFCDVYACIHDFTIDDIKFDPNEVDSVEFIPLDEFKTMMRDENNHFRKIYGTAPCDVLYLFIDK